MDYAIIGGDARFSHLARLLKGQGYDVGLFFHKADGIADALCIKEEKLSRAKNIIMNYPPNTDSGITYEEILSKVSYKAKIYLCGPKNPDACPLHRKVVNLWEDEALLVENAYLTAEGAVAAAMQASSHTMKDLNCMIIGWGRIGRALTEILVGLGAHVTVASRSEANRNRAIERGAESVALEDVELRLPEQRVIFSTPPSMVLDERTLKFVNEETIIIDLASPPYGVDLQAAWNRGLRTWREPGLPGRYCPESAGEALMKALKRAGGMENV